MRKRAKGPGQRKQIGPDTRAQVIIAVLGAVTAIAGCVAQFAR
ncbi:hypothetical protein GCM10020000_84520 [Streptomyces olivoverticillatus]